MTHTNGRLVIIEGLDGTGKTTLMWDLNEQLVKNGINIYPTWSPGDSAYSSTFDTFLGNEQAIRGTSLQAALLTRLADHAAHADEMITPNLRAGNHVITDRSLESFHAYQGEMFPNISVRKLVNILRVLDGVSADIREAADDILFIFLTADYDVCMERVSKRGQGKDVFEDVTEEEWLERLNNYRRVLGPYDKVLELDTSDLTGAEVLEAAYPVVKSFLEGREPRDQ